MKVIIKEKEYEYQSDYNKGWKFSAGDDFKFPVTIGPYSCFIKRFERRGPAKITGWGLLEGLKATFEPGLPRIHDIVGTEEEGREIYYVFYECLAGDTMDNVIRSGGSIDAEKLAEDLFRAIGSIHRHGYWFADFCEKNIFCTIDGRYFLVDLDSAQPESAAPDNEMFANKEYWALAFTFLIERAGCKSFKPADISGVLLNYIQALLLVLRVRVGLIDKKEEFKSTSLYNQLPLFLDQAAPEFKKTCRRLLERTPQAPDESEIKLLKALMLQRIVKGTVTEEETTVPQDGFKDRHQDNAEEGEIAGRSDRHAGKMRDRHAKKDRFVMPPWLFPPWLLKGRALFLLLLIPVALVAGWVVFNKIRSEPVNVQPVKPDTSRHMIPIVADSGKSVVAPVKVNGDSIIKAREDSIRLAKERALEIRRRKYSEDSVRRVIAENQRREREDSIRKADSMRKPVEDGSKKEKEKLEKKLLDSITIINNGYGKDLFKLSHRTRIILENRSGYFLDKVTVEIINPAMSKNEIMTLSQVKPHSRVILLENLPRDRRIKGIVRSVYL